MFDVSKSLIRYWDSKFEVLKPHKNGKGNRMFRPEDIENFKIIYHLVKERGMTLEGAKRAMRQNSRNSVSRAAELTERLQALRALLVEIRDTMGEDIAEPEEETAVEETAPEEPKNTVTVIEPKEPKETPKAAKPAVHSDDLPFYEQTLF